MVFDVYGTLLISAGAEMLDRGRCRTGSAAFAEQATIAAGIALPRGRGGLLASALSAEIGRHRAEAQAAGVCHPDPDIRDSWRAVLSDTSAMLTKGQVERLAVEFELRANPVWPMPHARATLHALHGRVKIGIVSNAQFYTPLVLEALLGPSFADLVPRERRVFSYQHDRAKPDLELFEVATKRFEACGIGRSECLFVGNDLRNDVWAAAACGWRTALFAGDARSLRLRNEDERCRGLYPDLILTSLAQLPPLLRGSE